MHIGTAELRWRILERSQSSKAGMPARFHHGSVAITTMISQLTSNPLD